MYFCIPRGLCIWPPERLFHVTRRKVSESAVSWPLMAAPKIGASEASEAEQPVNGGRGAFLAVPQPYHGSSRHKFQDSWAQFPATSGGLKEGFGSRQEACIVEIAESLAGSSSFFSRSSCPSCVALVVAHVRTETMQPSLAWLVVQLCLWSCLTAAEVQMAGIECETNLGKMGSS